MEVEVSSSQVVFATPCPSVGGLLTLFPCSSMRSLSQETVFHKLLQCESFSHAAALHELPHGSQSFRNRLPQRGSSTGPQVLPGACSSKGFTRGHCLLQAYICSSMGSSMGYRWISAPPWTSMDCNGTVYLTLVFIMDCRGKVSAPVSGAPPPPPSSLTFVSLELFLSHSLTPLSRLLPSHSFFSLLSWVRPGQG